MSLFIYWQLSWWAYIILLLIHLGVTTWGVFDVRLKYFMPIINNFGTNEKAIALTFDDGPTEFTPQVLDLLKQYQMKATFFCIGKQLEQYPEIAERIVAEGHLIANHTYSHSNQTGFWGKKKLLEEFSKTDQLLERITQKKNKFFRPPFGVTNPHIAGAVREKKYQVIGWSIRSLDTVIEDENLIFDRITSKLTKGKIILLHDISQKTINILARLLLLLKQNEYVTLTIEEFQKQ
ncbi:polysaccharide deacetylase family protein [Flavobacterium oreochromis]|nr:polysaccharide deacetylase family protein [Flavobacterium oreochromis]